MKDIRLKRQLRAQATSRHEADDLAVLASGLRRMPLPHLSQDAKNGIAEQLGIHPQRYHIEWRLGLAAGFAVVAFMAVSIQTATPRSHMYTVKNTVDKLIPWSHPVPAIHQPLAPRVEQPTQPVQAPATHDDSKAATPPFTHATDVLPEQPRNDTTSPKQPELLQQPSDKSSSEVNTDKVPKGLQNILSQPLPDQADNQEKY